MDVATISMTKTKARELYREYKKHQHYSEPIDLELQRTYQLLAQGKTIIQALESIKTAGLDEKGYPKLAIARADQREVFCTTWNSGACEFRPESWGRRQPRRTISLPAGSFTSVRNGGISRARAALPLIPIKLRPKRGLFNYHVLWEAEWTPVPVRDPYLLRRIGKADLWLVVAAWELSEVERAALSTRIAVQ